MDAVSLWMLVLLPYTTGCFVFGTCGTLEVLLDNVDRVLYYGMLFMFVYVCIYIHFHMYVKSKVMKCSNFVSKLSRH